MEYLWIVVLLFAAQPVLRQRLLEGSRSRQLKKIQSERGSSLISLVHRQETMSLLGIPVFRYIDIEDAERVLQAIQQTAPETPIDLILHTPGGLVLPSTQIARALAHHPGKVTVFVPHYAMSGGTLIALAADEIVMSEHAVLGPVDPQLGRHPAASILRAVERKPDAEIDDETLILADQARMAMDQLRDLVGEILCERMDASRCRELAEKLSDGSWTHDFPITPEHARKLGLEVGTDIPNSIVELMSLYPQATRRQPSVEFLPWPQKQGGEPRPGDG